MIVLMLSGKQGAGKSTTAKALEGVLLSKGIASIRFKFGDIIYAVHDAVWATLEQYGVTRPGDIDVNLLRVIGTEYGRKYLGDDVWVEGLKRRVLETEASIMSTMMNMGQDPSSFERVYLVDDLRFKSEFDLNVSDTIRVRLEAPAKVRKARAEKWTDETEHKAETDLDSYVSEGKFDLVLDTSKLSVDEVVDQISEFVFNKIKERSCTSTSESSASQTQ